MTFQIRKAASFCQARRLRGCAGRTGCKSPSRFEHRYSPVGRSAAGAARAPARRAGPDCAHAPAQGRGTVYASSVPGGHLRPGVADRGSPHAGSTHTMRKRNLQLACRSTSASRIAKFCGIAGARGPGAPVGERALFGGGCGRQIFAPGQPAALPSLTQTPSGWRVRATLAQSCVRRTSTGDTTCWMYMKRLPPSV